MGDHVTEDPERANWNRRYRGGGRASGSGPSAYLAESLPTVMRGTAGRRALDVACGGGRNSVYLARNGFAVTGVDDSDVALAEAARRARDAGLEVDFRLMNLDFLLRPLVPRLHAVTAPGGYLLMEVLLQSGAGAPRHNPEFAVESGELAALFAALPGTVVASSEDPDRGRARILFRKA
jgi:SAM-dependent methyltransferase